MNSGRSGPLDKMFPSASIGGGQDVGILANDDHKRVRRPEFSPAFLNLHYRHENGIHVVWLDKISYRCFSGFRRMNNCGRIFWSETPEY